MLKHKSVIPLDRCWHSRSVYRPWPEGCEGGADLGSEGGKDSPPGKRGTWELKENRVLHETDIIIS